MLVILSMKTEWAVQRKSTKKAPMITTLSAPNQLLKIILRNGLANDPRKRSCTQQRQEISFSPAAAWKGDRSFRPSSIGAKRYFLPNSRDTSRIHGHSARGNLFPHFLAVRIPLSKIAETLYSMRTPGVRTLAAGLRGGGLTRNRGGYRPPVAAVSARRTARSFRTHPAGMDRSPARSRSSATAFPEPVTSQRMDRARSIAGKVSVIRLRPF